MEQIIKIGEFILDSFIHIWPYLVITIPLAVFVKLSGVSKLINRVMGKNPWLSVILATIVGAFSPFCSCGVIPIIASLLIGGVPLAPVISFWIASPSMDPEIFMLSVASIGWELSIWRLAATFIISLFAGFTTHILMQKGWIQDKVLKENLTLSQENYIRKISTTIWKKTKMIFSERRNSKVVVLQLKTTGPLKPGTNVNCCVSTDELQLNTSGLTDTKDPQKCTSSSCNNGKAGKGKTILIETWKAGNMVIKFMALAFFINAIIHFYIPQDYITNLLGDGGYFSVLWASIIGIPVYTSNITALPLVSGLLDMGLNKGAALAFLISGPITTLPAMAAVWGIVRKRIFTIYISFGLLGAIAFGLLIQILNI